MNEPLSTATKRHFKLTVDCETHGMAQPAIYDDDGDAECITCRITRLQAQIASMWPMVADGGADTFEWVEKPDSELTALQLARRKDSRDVMAIWRRELLRESLLSRFSWAYVESRNPACQPPM